MNVARGWGLWLAGLLTACALGTTMVEGQAAPPAGAQQTLLAEQVFKNVQVLRGIPVKEFMETMGFFAASLSLNCSDCHSQASASNWANYADDIPIKQQARRMVVMVNTINKMNFGGAPAVTCYTCHRGSQRPKVIPSLAQQYAAPPDEDPDEVIPLPVTRPGPTADQILDRYLQAVGGAAALAKLTSFTAKGTYDGFDSDFEKVPVDVYVKAPNQRTTVIHFRGGDSTTTFDGRESWNAGPQDLAPLTLMPLVGAAMQGNRLDAQLSFPGQIKQVLTDLRTNFAALRIDNRPVDIIEGKTPEGGIVKLYFDRETGFLVRSVRYSRTAVGTNPINVVYSNYQDVPGLGIKLPYTWVLTWTNGRGTYEMSSLQPNVNIEAARFGKPTPPAAAQK
ncbi:MAG: photosynthetic reaction center cytochrome c subunit [Acidobacteria bacterium]|nr:photosynthetic reaction center cytochrome c subunit [Acidobacteriota bacterium]